MKDGNGRYFNAPTGSLLLFFFLLFTPSLSAVTITNRPTTIEDLAGKIPPQNSIGGNPAPTTHCIQVVDFGGDGSWFDPATKMLHTFELKGHPVSGAGKFMVNSFLDVTIGQHDNDLNVPPYSITHFSTVKPLEFVLVDFASDCNFTDPQSGSAFIKAGSRLVVPMLWAYWFMERFEGRKTEAKVRVLADVVAAALSFGEANVVLRGLELLFSVADIAITINRNQIELNYGQQGTAFLAAWDNLFLAYGSLFIAQGAARVVNKVAMSNTLRNFTTQAAREQFVRLWVNFTEAIRNLPEATAAGIQQLGLGWRRVMAEVYNAQLDVAFVLSQPALATRVVARWVGDQVRAMVVTAGLEVGIANLQMLEGGGQFLMTNVRWLPAEVQQVQVVGRLENVVYKDAQGVSRNGSVEIVFEPVGGQYYVRVELYGGRQFWNGYSNIFKATTEEIAAATSRIKNYRTENNLSGGNYGYLEGIVNATPVDNRMWRSIPIIDAEKEIHIFDAIPVQGGNGREWLRITDSEYRMLNKLASDLGGSRGVVLTNITGELKIVSENPYCASCTGIIQQFHEMFPKIKLILVDGAK